ncbi:protein DUF642 L-GALACTONO-1,4-LACTONE-RESPONSIVE GENE 2-like [Actinidia eriantha]|uniref:protein DUF642 L-GALACTONO-1,4-LACTONE-RESPONSIVE GENE 2-like n=1 Tax=Actinidia eriantha TaxID=165200 RepID=UPI002582CB7E|nr:protein DUF642 L-GALACTONO-1,4-LACTONE-RESPONSIVE GENE 2-like [Actinidia eriantha]
MAMSSADILQNPYFESPPTNITSNSSSALLLLTDANTIPGWSFSGTVRYVTSGHNISLSGNGHAVQLGPSGKINQTFRANGNYMGYLLTFTLAPSNEECFNNSIAVNVSAPGRSKVFSLERRYGKEMWQSHACYLGSWDDVREPINLEIQRASFDKDSNLTCDPIVDTFLITRISAPRVYSDSMLVNYGFEFGPAFLSKSSEGILLDEELDAQTSPLQQWSVIGTVKYIDSKHYSVPEGKAAVELVSGAPSGIRTIETLSKDSTYKLEFMVGDANDSCVGDFIVYAQVGTSIQNFTMRSNGTGSARKHSMTFKAESSLTPISFVSFNESQTSDHVFCGPVIDNVILFSSYALQQREQLGTSFSTLVVAVVILWIGS